VSTQRGFCQNTDVGGSARRLLAKRLRDLRARYRYTQQAVSERSGLDYKYYQRIEGKRPPNLTVDSLERLARVFGVGLSELLQRPDLPAASYARDAGAAPNIQHRLARRLRTLRRQGGWTPAELAQRTGLSLRQIQRLEDPRHPATARVDTLERLAAAFTLSTSQLLDC